MTVRYLIGFGHRVNNNVLELKKHSQRETPKCSKGADEILSVYK